MNETSRSKTPPKYGTEEWGHWYWHKPDLSSFPPSPCGNLCFNKGLKRFHLTCLTCAERRFRCKSWRGKNLREYKQVIMVMNPPDGKKFIVPEHYMTYGIILPTNDKGQVHPLKCIFIKYLMTIAERIAEF